MSTRGLTGIADGIRCYSDPETYLRFALSYILVVRLFQTIADNILRQAWRRGKPQVHLPPSFARSTGVNGSQPDLATTCVPPLSSSMPAFGKLCLVHFQGQFRSYLTATATP